MQATIEILKEFVLLYAHSWAWVALIMPITLVLAAIFDPVVRPAPEDKTEPMPWEVGHRFKRVYDLFEEKKNGLIFYRVFVLALMVTVVRCLG